MDWESAKKHCIERNWQWSLKFIKDAQEEMKELQDRLKKIEGQQKV